MFCFKVYTLHTPIWKEEYKFAVYVISTTFPLGLFNVLLMLHVVLVCVSTVVIAHQYCVFST